LPVSGSAALPIFWFKVYHTLWAFLNLARELKEDRSWPVALSTRATNNDRDTPKEAIPALAIVHLFGCFLDKLGAATIFTMIQPK
jgi:hypothetical protein